MSHPVSFGVAPEVVQSWHGSRSLIHWTRLGLFVALYGVGAVGAVMASTRLDPGWLWLLIAPFWILSAASLHGISLFTHEAVHGTLSRNSFVNDFLGAVCALPVLQNCAAYRVLHLRHHQHLGDEGDPDHYANYTRWTWMIFVMNWLRLLVGYPVYVVLIPLLGFKHGTARDRFVILMELAMLSGVVGLLIYLSPPIHVLLHGWILPMLLINTLVNVRGMSQHTLLGSDAATDPIRGTRSILANRVVRFFMCNENYHLEHHLYPGVPWHALPTVHQTLRPALEGHGAPYIPSYSAFVWHFLRHSVLRSPVGQYWRRTRPEGASVSTKRSS